MRFVLRVLFVLLLFSPLALLLPFVSHISLMPMETIMEALRFTFSQSVVSASLSVALGVLGAIALVGFPPKYRRLVIGLLVLPQIIPSIAIVVALLNILNPFPFGWWGVVLAHTLINAGLVTVLMTLTLNSRVNPTWLQQAQVLGAGKIRFWWNLLWHEFLPDICKFLLFIGFQCSLSFVVPLILGGFGNKSLEVLIYEQLRIHNEWSTAMGLALLQMALLLGFCLLIWFLEKPSQQKDFFELPDFKSWHIPLFSVPVVACSLVLLLGLVLNLPEGLERMVMLAPLRSSLWNGTLGTIALAGLVGVCTLGLLAWLTYIYPHQNLRRFVLLYVSPGAVLTGFGLLVLGQQTLIVSFLKMAFGITVVLFPWIYRSLFDGAWVSLQSQVMVAQTLGATPKHIFKFITWPQLRGLAYSAGALACFWTAGEFAISTLLSEGDWTLSVVIDRLVGSYRVDLALGAVWLMILAGFLAGSLLWVCQYVRTQKSFR